MSYLLFLVLLLLLSLFMLFKGYYDSIIRERQFVDSLKKGFGKPSVKSYKEERFARIDSYFRRHINDNMVDDITWNDLNMDEIFKSIDYTNSSCGEEYLYYRLRNNSKSIEELDKEEELLQFIDENEEIRVGIMKNTAKLGYVGKYSLYDYLDNLNSVPINNSLFDILCDLAFIPVILLLFINTTMGVILLITLAIFNVITYFKRKGEIEAYIVSFAYIVRLIDYSRKILEYDILPVKEEIEVLKEFLQRIKKIKKGTSFLGLSSYNMTGGNPYELLADYFKILFHLDIIVFMRMKKSIEQNMDDIDRLISFVGMLESSVSIVYYRKSLDEYCIPKLCNDKNQALRIINLYHPLINEPVKNDITADNSILITGSNASGKSTFLKAVALCCILGQTIHTCTAKEYESSLCYVYTSMALKDDIQNGESYYIVEIKALKRILDAVNNTERKIFCFVDEVLRGTNTIERIASATEILKRLNEKGAFVCAATHDIELTEILKDDFTNYHFEEEIVGDDIVFPYVLMKGQARTRNAIKLLQIMGFEQSVIEKASQRAMNFMETGNWI